MSTAYRSLRMRAAGAVLAASLNFGGCAGPMAEGARPSQPQASAQQAGTGEQEIGQITLVPRGSDQLANMQPSVQGQAQGGYSSSTDPFAMDSRMQGIASSLSGDSRAVAQAFFSRFHAGGSEGVIVMRMEGMQPRTASEALASGGDCTDLSTFAVPILRAKGVSGGVLVVHFESSPAGHEHMVPYVNLGGRETVFDLQAGALGQTAQGRYTIVMRMTFDQSAEMYHREMGDWLRDNSQPERAIAAYTQALQLFDGDAYAHQNLGVLLERAGRMDEANRHYQRAAQIDPSHYRRDQRRGTYNEEVQAAQQAMDRQDWAGCVTHLQNALNSGERISATERRTLEQSLSACRQRAGQ